MSGAQAFTYEVNPIGSGVFENDLIHQISPACVLTFLRWAVRDTLRTNPTGDLTAHSIVGPLVVENDCIQCSVSDNKTVLTPSMSATLLVTDVNYETAVVPGDFVFVNLLNWEKDARRIGDAARNNQPINNRLDGFKGLFKVQSVRKNLNTDSQTGTRFFTVKITGFAFTEFNNTIYFNNYLLDQSIDQNYQIYISTLANNWAGFVSKRGLTNIQDIIQSLINVFIGTGTQDVGTQVSALTPRSANNVQFFMPQGVGSLLGIPSVTAAKDIYTYLFGIQQYSSGPVQSYGAGMNPSGTMKNCDGDCVSKTEYWNCQKLWSILQQYSNSPLNELYTCFKMDKTGAVKPTVVLRQIPFTTSDFVAGDLTVTRFMSLPRWKIDPTLAYSFDLGRDEAARINFVQFFGKSVIGKDGYSISEEIAQGNYLFDKDDVSRSGLRPYIVNSLFDQPIPPRTDGLFRSPGWAKIIGDSLIGGHLKMNGTINFLGIQDPICVGDNLEFDSVVYHIEGISHVFTISPDGQKNFMTSVTLSNGVNFDSNNQILKYDEMDYQDAYKYRQDDYESEQLLPGISESQNTAYRSPQNPDTPHAEGGPFVQPNTSVSSKKTGRY